MGPPSSTRRRTGTFLAIGRDGRGYVVHVYTWPPRTHGVGGLSVDVEGRRELETAARTASLGSVAAATSWRRPAIRPSWPARRHRRHGQPQVDFREVIALEVADRLSQSSLAINPVVEPVGTYHQYVGSHCFHCYWSDSHEPDR